MHEYKCLILLYFLWLILMIKLVYTWNPYKYLEYQECHRDCYLLFGLDTQFFIQAYYECRAECLKLFPYDA